MITSLYQNLLNIEVAVFGIITAIIFVFVQIVYSSFSHRQIGSIFKNWSIIFYFVFALITLLFTILFTLLSSFEKYDFVSYFDFKTTELINNPLSSMLLVFGIAISLLSFFIFVIFNFEHLKPSKMLLLANKSIKEDDIKYFLWGKYGIDDPEKQRFFDIIFDYSNIKKYLSDEDYKKKLKETENQKEEAKRNEEMFNKWKVSDKKRYEKIIRKSKMAPNPLDVIDEIVFRAIKNLDYKTIQEVEGVIVNLFKDFIKKTKRIDDIKRWDPNRNLLDDLTKYFVDVFCLYLEVCDKEGYNTMKISVLNMTKGIIKTLIDNNEILISYRFLSLWKQVGKSLINKSSLVFISIVRLFRWAAEMGFEKDDDKICEEVSKNLGVLGEELITKKRYEEKPVMHDDDYTSEFDELLYTLFSFNDFYRKHPEKDPLIYFDAIDVILIKLLRLKKEYEQYNNLNNHIFDCFYVFYTFAEEAIKVSNTRGVALAVNDLCRLYKPVCDSGIEQVEKQLLELLVELGVKIAGQKDKLPDKDFLTKDYDNTIIDTIKDTKQFKTIRNAVLECIIKVDRGRDYEKVWGFIKKMGKEMRSNFGMMFDWETGNNYTDNDPRRV